MITKQEMEQEIDELNNKIAKLEEELERYKGTKLGDFAEEIRALKQQLHELPKKFCEEIVRFCNKNKFIDCDYGKWELIDKDNLFKKLNKLKAKYKEK